MPARAVPGINYAVIAQRDRIAAQIAQETGCGFVEAWLRARDREDRPRVSKSASEVAQRYGFREPSAASKEMSELEEAGS